MRVVPADRIARPPTWAVGVVATYLAAVGACALLAGSAAPILCMLRRVTGYGSATPGCSIAWGHSPVSPAMPPAGPNRLGRHLQTRRLRHGSPRG